MVGNTVGCKSEPESSFNERGLHGIGGNTFVCHVILLRKKQKLESN